MSEQKIIVINVSSFKQFDKNIFDIITEPRA